MKTNRFIKILACSVSVISSVLYFNYGALSIIDFSAGENELINNETTPFKVNITSGNKIAAVIPVGIGVRGDADESGNVSLYDAIEISKYLINKPKEGYLDSLGFAMSDTDLNGQVDLYDAINVAKTLYIPEPLRKDGIVYSMNKQDVYRPAFINQKRGH